MTVPASLPPAADLIEAVREFLEREVLPTLTGDRRFNVMVALNVLAIVRRELELGPALADREREGLAALLGRDGTLAELNRDLARRIREGTIDGARPDVAEHLRRTVRDALTINNPRWLWPVMPQK
jgi:hypothetical protein